MNALSIQTCYQSLGSDGDIRSVMRINVIQRLLARLWFTCFSNDVKFAGEAELCESVSKERSLWGRLYSVEMSTIRSWGGRKLQNNPFVKLLTGDGDHDDLLENYIAIVDSLANVDDISLKIEQHGYPWDEIDKAPNKADTLNQELGNYGYEDQSSSLAECEVKRLIHIHRLIQKSGYNHKLGVISPLVGDVLEMNGRFVVLIRHGEHRVAAMYANGSEKIPVLLSSSRFFSISEGKTNFDSEYYSIEEIMKIFNLIFVGDDSAPLYNIKGYFFDGP